MFSWAPEVDVAKNIAHLFGIKKLPVNISTNITMASENECFICFTSCIENEEIPSKWCNNDKCSSWYHHSCLLQVFIENIFFRFHKFLGRGRGRFQLNKCKLTVKLELNLKKKCIYYTI